MPITSKPSLWLSVLLVAAVGAASALYYLKETERHEKLRIRGELTKTISDKKKLETTMKDLEVSSAALEEKIKSQEELAAITKHNLEEQQGLRQKAEAEIYVKQSEIDDLKNQLHKAEDEKRELQTHLEKQYEDYYSMKSQLKSILKTKEELEAKAKDLAENGPVSLGTIVVRQNSK